ncbi:MAG: lipid II flippase MurJ [Gordonia sp. (in: high G+C Gram-positive bacteria)]
MSDRGPGDPPHRAAPRRVPPQGPSPQSRPAQHRPAANPVPSPLPGPPPARRPAPRPSPKRQPPEVRGAGPAPLAGPLAEAPPISASGPGLRPDPPGPNPGRPAGTLTKLPRQSPTAAEPPSDDPGSPRSGESAATPVESATEVRDSDTSILKTSGSIALATLISRITGFVRTVLILALLGASLASAFNAADVLPNMIAEVLLGAVLTAIVIPLLARAEAEDDDAGESFTNKIFTLTLVVLGIGTVAAVAAAPLLTSLNVDSPAIRPLATGLAYFLLVEILFYGLTALFIAILNLKGRFKPGAWAPVLNNVIQITTFVVYALVPGDLTLNPVRMTDPQLLVLGIGCALGVVLQAMVLVPSLRRAGVRFRLEWGIDARLRTFGNMAVAIVSYVAILQVGLVITYRIASSQTEAGISAYFTHWQLLQLPYGVLGVTILTAIMPRLSRNAAANDNTAVVDDMSLATRLTMVALVPAVAYMTFFGPAIGVAVFNFGRFDAEVAAQLGSVLSWGAFTLIPYAMTLVQLRVFYAREDAWTPTAMVLGITAVKVGVSYLGPVLFDDPELVIRWLALSNGLGYLVGAVVGHYLLRSRLGGARLSKVSYTTIVTIGISVGAAALVWQIARLTGLDRAADAGKLGSIAYLVLTAIVVLGVIYMLLAAAGVPDVVVIFAAVRRIAGRFIPALAPPPSTDPEPEASITVAFPKITTDESLPYSGQVQVLRRFDRGTATWQSYAVHSGGAAGGGVGGWTASPPPDMRYRRRGVRRVSENGVDTTGDRPGTHPAGPPPRIPDPDRASPVNPPRRRGPRLTPGAAVAGGRYRLLDSHGGTRGLQFWRAQDINLDREVGLTFVDADQLAPPPERDHGRHEIPKNSDTGPQAVLTRTLRLGQINSAGVARVLDVVRGSSGGIVVTEWVPGSSLAEVARSHPSPIGAARAVRALAAAAEAAHRSGGALSIDHPSRIRISTDGNAVLAFPGTLAGDDNTADVRGLGAVLYALLLQRWPLDGETGTTLVTTAISNTEIGGLPAAIAGTDGKPIEPIEADSKIPFEISAVAARALDGTRGIRTAATVQQVLDQATVVDLKTDLLPALATDEKGPVTMADPASAAGEPTSRRRRLPLLIGAGLLVLFIVIALVVALTNIVGSDDKPASINQFLSSTPATPGATAAGAAVTVHSATLVDYSGQSGDNPDQAANVITGADGGWRSDPNYSSASFGGLKDGLGLMMDFGSAQTVKTVTIATDTPGFDVSIRTATTGTATLDQTTEVTTATVDQPTTTLTIENPRRARHVLVWITSLPQADDGYQVQISKISMTH